MKQPQVSPSIAVVVSLLALFSGPVFSAERYIFEMILFERPSGGASEFWPSDPGEPDPQMARATLAAAALPATARRLGPIAYTLRRRGMVIHQHIVWSQVPGRRNSQSWRWVEAGQVRGLVRVTRGRFLHLDTDLLLQNGRSPGGYRVQLNRRLRSDELHYVDHPKLGVIIRATRVAAPSTDSTSSNPDAGEPKPAAPSGTAAPPT